MNIPLLNIDASFPFEGEKHQATIVQLPFRNDVWRENAKPALLAFINVIKAIAFFEHVIVCVSDQVKGFDKVEEELKGLDVEFLSIPYDDSWARDNSPVFLKRKDKIVAVDFGFNSWGGTYNGLYSSWENDNNFGKKFIVKNPNIERIPLKDFILEPGSIHTNGNKTLITTEECLLSKGRNPNLNKQEIEKILKSSLNQEKVLWLPYGVYNDETTGHVDNMACFLDETHILLGWMDNEYDPQYERSRIDYKYLSKQTTKDGKRIEIIKMPFPGPLYETKQEAHGIVQNKDSKPREANSRLAGSYVNFYMGKDFIILPQFHCPTDIKAYQILKDFYKNSKKIIRIYSREILLGGGNIHCITKQIPDIGE